MKNILSIAGTDPTGGAGLQADIKSISAQGGYAMSVTTAVVAQNTRGVRSVQALPSEFIREQLDSVSDDVRIDAVKIGMLGDVPTIYAVAAWLDEVQPPIVVIDPVMVATSGDRLLDEAAEDALRFLLNKADLITPNLDELAILADKPLATDWSEAMRQGEQLRDHYQLAVVVKGGHFDDQYCKDALLPRVGEPITLSLPRVATRHTHGTGCSLSSALATLMARYGDWQKAFTESKQWLYDAIAHADALQVGQGHGPVHHFHQLYREAGRHDLLTPKAAPESAVTPAGEHTESWWQEAAALRQRIAKLPEVTALGTGDLPEADFLHYLQQDAVYLQGYARVLARCAQLAPDAASQAFWAQSSLNAIVAETELHGSHVDLGDPAQPSQATRSYLNHLLAAAAQGSYAVVVAAVLPCFWVYNEVGCQLVAQNHPQHPFADWLGMYADPAFAEATAEAVNRLENALANASANERNKAREAFLIAVDMERQFFALNMHAEQTATL